MKPMTFNTLTREQLEDELRRCNEQILKDGNKIADMKALVLRLRRGFVIDRDESCDADEREYAAEQIARIDHVLTHENEPL